VDFNNDGLLDLISGDRNGFISFFSRNPDQTLSTEPQLIADGALIDVGNNSAPCIVDWNEDGLLDLVVGQESPGNIRLYLNSGSASSYLFTTFQLLKCGGTNIKYSRCVPHIVDLNQDGKKDIVIGEDYGYVYYLENTRTNASPTFTVAVKLESDGAPISWPSGQTDTRVWVDDWNGDGVLDLLLGNYAKNLYLYRGINTDTLIADSHIIPETGGTVVFDLKAGTDHAGRNYLLLGTTTGTTPGTPLPGGLVTLPLNWDPLADLILLLLNSTVFSNFYGQLDVNGESTATLNMPSLPGIAGTLMHYGYCLNKPFDFVSTTVEIEVVP